MAKNDYKKESEELSVEEARALRLAKHNSEPKKPSGMEKREAFRLFWAEEKSKYGRGKELEEVLWVHLKAVGMDSQDKFEDGLKHFGLKK